MPRYINYLKFASSSFFFGYDNRRNSKVIFAEIGVLLEHFLLNRVVCFNAYNFQVSPITEMLNIIIEVIAGIFSIFATATKGFKQGVAGE
jgi:hypothetical protein